MIRRGPSFVRGYENPEVFLARRIKRGQDLPDKFAMSPKSHTSRKAMDRPSALLAL